VGFSKAVLAQHRRACKKTPSKSHGGLHSSGGDISHHSPVVPCVPAAPLCTGQLCGDQHATGAVENLPLPGFASLPLPQAPGLAGSPRWPGPRCWQGRGSVLRCAPRRAGLTPPAEELGRTDAGLRAGLSHRAVQRSSAPQPGAFLREHLGFSRGSANSPSSSCCSSLRHVFKQESTKQPERDWEPGHRLPLPPLGARAPLANAAEPRREGERGDLSQGGGLGPGGKGFSAWEAHESTWETSGRVCTVQKAKYCKQVEPAHLL